MQHSSTLEKAFCTNSICAHFSTPFAWEESSRCPLCNEPAQLFTDFPFLDYEKYSSTFAKDIGTTELKENETVSQWAGLSSLYLKDETTNPTGSFKERGTISAIGLHLLHNSDGEVTVGTVSTGNMAISTAFLVNRLQEQGVKVKSFIVVDKDISKEKLDLIKKAASKEGTTLFLVNGNYAKFHDTVYAACAEIRKKGKKVYAELTDDVFRISGYASLFTEIIDQLSTPPDFVIVPVASGGLFRVGVWAFELLKEKGKLSKVPRVVLVQEEGADPIVQAFNKHLRIAEPIDLSESLVAKAIDVSYSRSGTASLKSLDEKYHLCTSVSAEEIKVAQGLLTQQNFYVEEAGAVSVAAAKKLLQEGVISNADRVVAVLSGKSPKKRELFSQPIFGSTVINCNLNELKDKMVELL